MGRTYRRMLRGHGSAHARTRRTTPHGRDMPTRTFIGLIFLIIALVVASTPALLTPATRGVENVAVRAGVIADQEAIAKAAAAKQAPDTKKKGKPVPAYLAMRGYQLDKDGNLRDVAGDTRPTDGRGRLARGNARMLMPGELDPATLDAPPITKEGGVLLDAAGCPQFATGVDVAALMTDLDAAALYAAKAGQADDPAACSTLLKARVDEATAVPSDALPGDRRITAAALRDDTQQMLIETYASDMFLAMFGEDVDTAKLADDLRTQLRGSR